MFEGGCQFHVPLIYSQYSAIFFEGYKKLGIAVIGKNLWELNKKCMSKKLF